MFNLVYGISKWNNPSRPRTRHLANGNGGPWCGSKQKVFTWERETGTKREITCPKCARLAQGAEGYFQNGDLYTGAKYEDSGHWWFVAIDNQGRAYETEEIPVVYLDLIIKRLPGSEPV